MLNPASHLIIYPNEIKMKVCKANNQPNPERCLELFYSPSAQSGGLARALWPADPRKVPQRRQVLQQSHGGSEATPGRPTLPSSLAVQSYRQQWSPELGEGSADSWGVGGGHRLSAGLGPALSGGAQAQSCMPSRVCFTVESGSVLRGWRWLLSPGNEGRYGGRGQGREARGAVGGWGALQAPPMVPVLWGGGRDGLATALQEGSGHLQITATSVGRVDGL